MRPLLAVLFLTLCSLLRAQETWSTVTSPTTQNLWGACYGGGQFVAVGEGGTILTSPNGAAWTARLSGTTQWLLGVAYSADLQLYVAVGDLGTILNSVDAITWTARTSGTTQRLNGVQFGGDRFVAVGEHSTICVSVDGSAWNNANTGDRGWLRGLAQGAGNWLTTGEFGNGYHSTAGAIYASTSAPGSPTAIESVAFGRNGFLAVGPAGYATTGAPATAGGAFFPGWTARATGTTEALRSVIFFNNTFVAAGALGSIYLTPDGIIDWQRRATPTATVLNALAGGEGAIVALGSGGVILRSVASTTAPAVLTALSSQTVTVGDSVAFRVVVRGSLATYAWALNGSPLAETGPTLALAGVTTAQAGLYNVTATNAAGSVTSAATLVVNSTAGSIVDTTFSPAPEPSAAPRVMLPLADGRMLVGGSFTYLVDGSPQLGLARLKSDGSLDRTFRIGAGLDANGTVSSLDVQADGKILVAGKFTSLSGRAITNLARLNPDGSPDLSFAPAVADVFSATDSTGVTQVAVQADGGILVATAFKPLVRLLAANGATDSSFNQSAAAQLPPGTTGHFPVRLALDANSRIVCASANAATFRVTAAGLYDSAFQPFIQSGSSTVALALQPDGRVLVCYGRQSTAAYFHYVYRLNADGSSDPAFPFADISTFLTSNPLFLAVNPDGSFWVAGNFTTIGTASRVRVARYSSEGVIDDTYPVSSGPDAAVTAIAVQADGKPILAGSFTTIAGLARRNLARLNFAYGGPLPPAIVGVSPATLRVSPGDPARFDAIVTGTGPFAYSWAATVNGTTTTIATGTSAGGLIALPILAATESAAYFLVVNGPGLSRSSSYVFLSVRPTAPRFLTQPPATVIVPAGRPLTLTASVLGTTPITYQWFRDSRPISGPTNLTASLTLTGSAVVAGSYNLIVRNDLGITTSNPTVVQVDPAGVVVNISTRALVQTGDNVLIAGFVIDGPATKRLLIRGIGASLASFGLAGVNLADPELTLYDSAGAVLRTAFDQPGGTPEGAELDKARRDVGAFGISDTRDAAILADLGAGLYSVKISGTGGTTGVGLVEIYEVDKTASRLVNLSSRAFVSTGAAVTIPGFVIAPGTSRTLLIRGAGPALAAYGVTGTLANPTLRLVDANNVAIATNDNWETNTNLAALNAAATKVSAFPFAPGSQDAALLVTLPAGRYSALLEGANNSTGVALVELYEVQ